LSRLLLILSFGVLHGFADTNVVTGFEAANKLYAQSQFAAAATAYEQLIATGAISPALYFNLGNARFRAGQIGRAIAAYRRAGELAPRDPDVRANLQFARNRVPGPKLGATWWQRWIGSLSVTEWLILTTVAVWLTLGLFIARQIKPTLAASLRPWTWLGAATCVIFFVGAKLASTQSAARTLAIIAVPEATVRNGPFDESPAAFTAHDGAELRALDRKDDWLQVTDGMSRVGWVKQDAVVGTPRS
jgi:tetratricopeptide (TPR) repeat protein